MTVKNVPKVHIIVDGYLHKLCRVPNYINEDEACQVCSLVDWCNAGKLCLNFTNVLTNFRKAKL